MLSSYWLQYAFIEQFARHILALLSTPISSESLLVSSPLKSSSNFRYRLVLNGAVDVLPVDTERKTANDVSPRQGPGRLARLKWRKNACVYWTNSTMVEVVEYSSSAFQLLGCDLPAVLSHPNKEQFPFSLLKFGNRWQHHHGAANSRVKHQKS